VYLIFGNPTVIKGIFCIFVFQSKVGYQLYLLLLSVTFETKTISPNLRSLCPAIPIFKKKDFIVVFLAKSSVACSALFFPIPDIIKLIFFFY